MRWKVRAYPESCLGLGQAGPWVAGIMHFVHAGSAGLQVRDWWSVQAAWSSFPWKPGPAGGEDAYLLLLFYFFFFLHAHTLGASRRWYMCALTKHMHTAPLSLASLHATHTHTHKHPHPVPSTPGVDTNCKCLLCGSPSLCHQPLSFSKLPVGKTHNFYTTQSWLAIAGITVSLKCFLLGHLQAVLITCSLRGALLCPSLCLFVLCTESVLKGILRSSYTKKEKGGKKFGEPITELFLQPAPTPCPLQQTQKEKPALLSAGPCSQLHESLSQGLPGIFLCMCFILSIIKYTFKPSVIGPGLSNRAPLIADQIKVRGT